MNQNRRKNMRATIEYDQLVEENLRPWEEKWRREHLIKFHPKLDKDKVEKLDLWELRTVMNRLEEIEKEKKADCLIHKITKKD